MTSRLWTLQVERGKPPRQLATFGFERAFAGALSVVTAPA